MREAEALLRSTGLTWADIRRRAARERLAQGLPAKVRDPEVLAFAVRTLRLDRATVRGDPP